MQPAAAVWPNLCDLELVTAMSYILQHSLLSTALHPPSPPPLFDALAKSLHLALGDALINP